MSGFQLSQNAGSTYFLECILPFNKFPSMTGSSLRNLNPICQAHICKLVPIHTELFCWVRVKPYGESSITNLTKELSKYLGSGFFQTVLFEILIGQIVSKMPTFYRTQNFVTILQNCPSLIFSLRQSNPLHTLKNICKTYRKIFLTPTARHTNPQFSDRINVCFCTSHAFYMEFQFPLPSVDQPRNISKEYNIWLYTKMSLSRDTVTYVIMG